MSKITQKSSLASPPNFGSFDEVTQYLTEAVKAITYDRNLILAMLNRRWDTEDDILIDIDSSGVILKSPNAHYWRATVNDAGAFVLTDLGTTRP